MSALRTKSNGWTMRFCVGASAVALAAGSSGAALGETAPSGATPDDSHVLSEVVVTGTRIESKDAASAHPLTIIGNDTLQITNTVTVDDILTKTPGITMTYGPTTGPGQQTGTTAVDLRNLGANRTLVLMDGVRYTPTVTYIHLGVNLETIPVSLIDHIEVLRDGASPIYGADAVAGVVNIITKRDFEGFEADANGSVSGHGDQPVGHVSFTAGRNFERGNIVANFDASYKSGLLANQRSFTRYSVTQFVPNGDGTFTTMLGVPWSPGGTAVVGGGPVMFTAPGQTVPLDPQQLFLEQETASIINRIQTTTGTVQGHYDLTNDIEGYLQSSYSHEYTRDSGAPPSFNQERSSKYPTAGIVPADNPYNTLGQPVVPFYREYDEIGVRKLPTTVNTWRVLGGLRGQLANGWKWDAHYAYGASNTDTLFGNNMNVAHLVNAFDPALCATAPGCVVANPFGPGNISPAAADYIRLNDEFRNHYLQQLAGISLSGNALTLPAGPLGFAIGAERRREGGGTNYDPAVLAGDSSLTVAANTLGSYTANEGFAEVNIPVLSDVPLFKTLIVNPAFRYSDYSTFGGHSTWKVGVDWATGNDVRVRASKGTAFRAPDITELFGGAVTGPGDYADPCDAVIGLRGNPSVDAACRAQGLGPTFRQTAPKTLTTNQGNPLLRPESADEDNIGLVLTPHWMPRFTATVDYFYVNLRDTVNGPGAPIQILQNCYLAFSPGNQDCGLITRGADGQISGISLQKINVGATKTSGIDFSVADTFDVGAGRLSAGLQGSYLLSFQQQTAVNAGSSEYAGHFVLGSPGAWTRLRTNADVGYALGDWSLRYEMRYIKGATALDGDPTKTPAFYLSIPDVYYHDLAAAFRHGPYTFVAGVENFTDKQPPKSYYVDVLTYDLVGRNFFMKASLRY